ASLDRIVAQLVPNAGVWIFGLAWAARKYAIEYLALGYNPAIFIGQLQQNAGNGRFRLLHGSASPNGSRSYAAARLRAAATRRAAPSPRTARGDSARPAAPGYPRFVGQGG